MNDIIHPPSHLRLRVHGATDVLSFDSVGESLVKDIYEFIYPENRLDKECHRVLDWGCGCARVTQGFRQLFPKCDLYGSDIDTEAVSWCKENLSHIANFSTNDAMPPLDFSDEFFDFIYGISVFTHLPEDMAKKWIEELHRTTKQGGHVLLTIHGSQYQHAGHVGNGFSYEKHPTQGLPEYYGNSYHTKQYIYDEWGKVFKIKKFSRPQARRQDVILCEKN